MTCLHVLGLIDAGPLADYPSTHMDAAWAHARECATCGAAMRAAATLTAELSALPHPEPPQHLAPAVLARIARLPAAPGPRPAVLVPARAGRRWQDHAAAAAGVLAAGLIAVLTASGHGPALDLLSPWISAGSGLIAMERTTTWWVTLAVSLVIYVAGLFAPVRGVSGRPG